MTAQASRVYLLCFGRPYHHARHYVGIALDGDVQRRVAEHLAGQGSSVRCRRRSRESSPNLTSGHRACGGLPGAGGSSRHPG